MASADEISYRFGGKVVEADPPLADREMTGRRVMGYLTPMYDLESWQRFGSHILRRRDGAR